MSSIVEADTLHDPVDGWVAVIYCPECDGAFGVQTDADIEVADEHVQACSGQADGLAEIKHLELARRRASHMNVEERRQDARDSYDR